jgi:hypothetical protein
MQEAFQSAYGRDWSDPAGDDMKAIWAKAWEASQKALVSRLTTTATQLRSMPIKGKIGDWHDAQKDADAFDASVRFLSSNN